MTGEQRHKYPDVSVSLTAEVVPPSYDMVLSWMRSSSARAVSFDIWARGNYLRRVIDHARRSVHPLVVPVNGIEEMRWAYRRLALLDIPVDFVYTGGVSDPKKILTLYPADDNMIDGGWGYIGALGTIIKVKGRKWFPVIGCSQLMPESLLDWLVEEAGDEFGRGQVFIAPAELIGVDPARPDLGMSAIEDVTAGRRLMPATSEAGPALLTLDLPYLDGMRPKAFRRLLNDHADELVRFRSAFRRLVAGAQAGEVDSLVDELRVEVAEMSLASRYASMRRDISALGGVLVAFSAAVAAAAAAAPESALPVASTAGAAAATAALLELWKQRAERHAKLRESPYFIMWALGVDRAALVRRTRPGVEFRRYQRVDAVSLHTLSDFHWLCPPTPGMAFLAIPQEPGGT